MPNAKVLLLGVLPKGVPGYPTVPHLNTLISHHNNDKNVFFLDMYNHFMANETNVNDSLYVPDHVHLTKGGYQVWYETMEPLLEKLLK